MAATGREVRKTVIALALGRQRRGYGSLLSVLEGTMKREAWWSEVDATLAGTRYVVIGGVAVNSYMAPRPTIDLAIGVLPADLPAAEAAIEASGWRRLAPVRPTDPNLAGWAWSSPSAHELDIFSMSHPWAPTALADIAVSPRTDLPTLAIEYLVLMKITVGRTGDIADLSRMLGGRSAAELERIRAAVCRFQPDDLDDVEQLIRLGQLERDS
jgi:hypothetical protein